MPNLSHRDVTAAPDDWYLLGNDLSGRLGTKDRAWWAGLAVTARTSEQGIECWSATDADGARWRIRLARWSAPAASRLETEAAVALRLGAALAEVPLFMGGTERPALVYPARSGQTLAEAPRGIKVAPFLDLALAATAALAQVHAAGIIHGALTPGRVLIEPDGRVRFADFAVLGDRSLAEHDFAYAAPELLRTEPAAVDARVDLYALGVMLYELLAGRLPLTAASLADWLHAHVAMDAPSVRLARPEVPAIIDRILLKLISKEPRQRYQTAEALHADLRRVARTIAATGAAGDFVLARGEFADLTRASAHLVGRDRDRATLLDAHAAARRSSRGQIVLVTGEAGAGKSALVDGVLDTLRDTGALCTTGKGVQLRQGTPFAPAGQALRSAIAAVMGADAALLEGVRARLGTIVGSSRMLAELAPEATLLPPETHALADVPAHLAQARATRIVAETFAALASPEAPLVLFLDDLQWFDQASLNVVRHLCAAPPPHVLLICSYRQDAEGRGALKAFLEVARGAGTDLRELRLAPLDLPQTADLIALTLNSAPDDVRAMAAFFHREAGGNPFHIGQLLQRMREDRALRFDADAQAWHFDPPHFDPPHLGRQHEVLELMQERIGVLPPLQREVLRRCASLGGRLTTGLAAQLCGIGPEEAARAAGTLVAGGLLRRAGAEFAIVHDRVLEAAYADMAPDQRADMHLGNARCLAAGAGVPDRAVAFDIAAQVERCDLARLGEDDRRRFAGIVLQAARTARSAGDAERALQFAELIGRMRPDAGADDPPGALPALAFETEWLRCDCLLALARVEEALSGLDGLARQARDPIDMADVYRLRAIAQTVKGAYGLAIDAALQGLRVLDIALDPAPAPQRLEESYRRCLEKLAGLSMDELLALDDMTDRRARSALALLSTLISSFFVKGELRFLHAIRIIELTLEHGLAPETAYGLAWFGVLSAHHYGAHHHDAYETGTAYATAACTLAARDGYEAQRTAALLALDQVSVWTKPMRTALDHAREGARVGQAAGDLGMTCYALNHIGSDLIIIGERLDRLRPELAESLSKVAEIGYTDILAILTAQLGFVDSVATDEPPAPLDPHLSASSVATQFWVLHYAGLQAFFRGEMETALDRLEAADALAWAAPAHIDTASCCFFLALARVRAAGAGPLPGRIAGMADARARFTAWAALNPETFSCKHLLLEAEAARLSGQLGPALLLYEQSANAAGAAGFIHDQALAHELAGQCYLDAGLTAPAQGCLQAAARCYRQWGAHRKADEIGARLPTAHDPHPTAAPGQIQDALDLAVMSATSQTLAEEIGLEQVVRTLMKSMIVHAGAQFGLLLLLREGTLVAEAAAQVQSQELEIVLKPGGAPEARVPPSVLNTVLRTARPIILGDAAREAADRGLSMGERPVRSLACIPLLKRGELIGILYLENALAADVFTPRRMAMLDILAPQAAISLDAARLYGDLMEENLRRARAEFDLREARSELAQAAQMTAMGSFATSIAHEVNQPLGTIVAHSDAALRWLDRPEPDLGEATRSLKGIRDAGRRAADIIKALRALVKPGASELSPLLIERVVEEVLRLVEPDMRAHHVQLDLALAAAPRAVMADAVQIQQVAFNLVTNAIHAMETTPPEARRLRVATSAREGHLEVTITDTGCGMAPEVLARIFRPFFTTKAAGMGVGLAICKSIVERHGGALEATSEAGAGSTFSIRMPFAVT